MQTTKFYVQTIYVFPENLKKQRDACFSFQHGPFLTLYKSSAKRMAGGALACCILLAEPGCLEPALSSINTALRYANGVAKESIVVKALCSEFKHGSQMHSGMYQP